VGANTCAQRLLRQNLYVCTSKALKSHALAGKGKKNDLSARLEHGTRQISRNDVHMPRSCHPEIASRKKIQKKILEKKFRKK
jgi:hypothetical protein